jgi:hypothetical protein
MKPFDIIAGLPVYPRFPLSRNCYNSILIAALLHQPIIVRGHHHDVAEGLQLLADVSGFVNSLGNVHWSDIKRISRSHYARRFEETNLRIRMFSKRIEVSVPEGVYQILVERPSLQGVESVPLAWRLLGEGSEWKSQRPDDPIPVFPGQTIVISAEPPTSPCIDAKNFSKFHLWPVVRRQLTEARDRIAPLLRKVAAFSIRP